MHHFLLSDPVYSKICVSITLVIQMCSLHAFPSSWFRELETRVGATPPPSPKDRTTDAALNSRVVQLSTEVERLKKELNETEAKSECVSHTPTIYCTWAFVLLYT